MRSEDIINKNTRAEEIFFEAIDIEDHSKREIYLQEAFKGDPQLKKTVLSMLADFPKANEFFNTTSRNLSIPVELLPDEELSDGVELGPYRIIRLLGEGGSSKVYEAEQKEPVHRRVALKILKLGMDTRSVIKRFESERQTLAMLEHANISRVFDAGTTSTGRPFFVMELVHGTKITDYCEKHMIPPEERLRIMSQVCSALQHAHNKGIIHRDIKPSNILVSDVDGVAVPKLIDFGIAKATDAPANDGKTLLGQPIGTPAYMSPEQFSIGTKDIDTRSDIYSLGIVLYELLSGEPAFDNDELLDIGYDAMRRKIQFDIPKRPLLTAHVNNRTTREELNWIAMKAIEKDREQRYSTAHALAGDLESYLKNEPVTAHPPSRLYRLKKLWMRNRLASISIAIAVVALVMGFTISTVLFVRARNAEIEQTKLRVIAEERAHVTNAAILIMQNKIAEADDEIRRMGGLLSQPSLEATNVFRTLAMWNAIHGEWETSADRWLAMSRVNQFDENDMTDKVTENLLPIAPILLKTFDYIRYHEFQDFLLERLGKTTHPFATEHLLKLCLLAPASPQLLHSLQYAATIAEQSLPGDEFTVPEDWMEAWRCVALAMWYYRNDNPAAAIPWCNRSLLRPHGEESRVMQSRLLLAMCNAKTGDIERALTELNIARTSVEFHLKQPLDEMSDGYFHDWMIAEILLKEAEAELAMHL